MLRFLNEILVGPQASSAYLSTSRVAHHNLNYILMHPQFSMRISSILASPHTLTNICSIFIWFTNLLTLLFKRDKSIPFINPSETSRARGQIIAKFLFLSIQQCLTKTPHNLSVLIISTNSNVNDTRQLKISTRPEFY